MYQAILKKIQKLGYFDKHQNVLISVSGGVDSMNLLHFLHSLQDVLQITIAIAHVNHQQREQSKDEEVYLREWAKIHGIAIHVDYFEGKFSEKTAREFRYRFFKRLMSEYGYTALVTGHHADDQIETLMMRFIRGSRLRHLIGIKPVQKITEGEIIRPFLTIKKSDFPEVFHFEDQSNADITYFRNRVRHQHLPSFVTENPRFKKHLQGLSTEISLLLEALSDLTKTLDVTKRSVFLNQTPAVQTYLLQDYLEQFTDLQLTKAQFNQVLHLLQTKPNYHQALKSGYYLQLTDQNMVITKISLKTDRNVESTMIEYGGVVIFNQYRFTFQNQSADEGGLLLPSQSPIVLRYRQSGDRLVLGDFSKKVSRIFIDDKISLEERAKAVVGEQDGQIIFVLTRDKTYLRKFSKHDTIKARLYIQKEKW